MRTLLIASGALGLATIAQSQSIAEAMPAPSAPVFAGTYKVATGEFIPATAPGTEGGGTPCSLGRVYNNSSTLGFFLPSSGGNTIIDEGQIPSTSSGGFADSYLISSFPVSYITNVPTVDFQINFWENGLACGELATLGTPTAEFTLTGLPGSTTGMNMAFQVDIDLTGGMEFTMLADGNGVGGDGDGDLFSWSYKVLGQDPVAGDTTGFFIASDPANCATGAGLFEDTGIGCDGLGSGSGIGTLDLFRIDIDGTDPDGCFFFGGYDPTSMPPVLFASFFMELETSMTGNDGPDAATDLGMALGTVVNSSTCCATTSDFMTCGVSIGFDRFYTWTAPMDGVATIDTEGSNYDTLSLIHI